MQFKEYSTRESNKKLECQVVYLNSGLELLGLVPLTIVTSDYQLLVSLWNYFPFVFRMQDRKPSRPSLLHQVSEFVLYNSNTGKTMCK